MYTHNMKVIDEISIIKAKCKVESSETNKSIDEEVKQLDEKLQSFRTDRVSLNLI